MNTYLVTVVNREEPFIVEADDVFSNNDKELTFVNYGEEFDDGEQRVAMFAQGLWIGYIMLTDEDMIPDDINPDCPVHGHLINNSEKIGH